MYYIQLHILKYQHFNANLFNDVKTLSQSYLM